MYYTNSTVPTNPPDKEYPVKALSSPDKKLTDWLWFINEHKLGATDREATAVMLLNGQRTEIRFEDIEDVCPNAWLGPIVFFACSGRKYEMYEGMCTGDSPRAFELTPNTGSHGRQTYKKVSVPTAHVRT